MKISTVYENSLAERLGLLPGDEIVRIDDHPVRDPIDFQFYSAEERYTLLVRRGGMARQVEVDSDEGDWLGLEFSEMEYKRCGNKCIFCFVDQNPGGLRDALYFKDEDFRLSFLYGNYVTLTNLSHSELERIAEQRLSPLCISVHSTEDYVRAACLAFVRMTVSLKKSIFWLKPASNCIRRSSFVRAGMTACTCSATLEDLAAFYPAVQTVAVVPLGLTGHRAGLTLMRAVSRDEAAALLVQEKTWVGSFRKKLGCAFVYFADEFYCLPGRNSRALIAMTAMPRSKTASA